MHELTDLQYYDLDASTAETKNKLSRLSLVSGVSSTGEGYFGANVNMGQRIEMYAVLEILIPLVGSSPNRVTDPPKGVKIELLGTVNNPKQKDNMQQTCLYIAVLTHVLLKNISWISQPCHVDTCLYIIHLWKPVNQLRT